MRLHPPTAALALCLGALAAAAEEPGKAEGGKPFRPTGFQLYYGADRAVLGRLTDGLREGHVVVIDSRSLKADDLGRLRRAASRAGAKVLGYVSVGELNDGDRPAFGRFLAGRAEPGETRTADSVVIGRNEEFGSARVDVLAGPWRDYAFALVDAQYAAGLDGVFLDTVDTADVYLNKPEWKPERKARSVGAMKALIRAAKARHRDGYVLQNRGLNLIGDIVFVPDSGGLVVPGLAVRKGHPDNPDGILYENAFAGTDDWSRRVEGELRAIHKEGKAAVFALGYRVTLKSPDAFFRRAAEEGFVPAWATSSRALGEELARGPAAGR